MVNKLSLYCVLVFVFSVFTANAQEATLVGSWVPESGQRISSDFIEKRLELLNNGIGVGDGYSLKWTTDKGHIIFRLDIGSGFAYSYQVSASTLILTNDKGASVRYKKEGGGQSSSRSSSPAVEAQSNKSGEFTLINIPSKYNGKYAVLEGDDEDSLELMGCVSTNPLKASRIIDGKVILPMWIKRSNGKFERYSGNHSLVDVTIYILGKENDDFDDSLDDVYFTEDYNSRTGRLIRDDRVKFSNGNVTKSYNESTFFED